MTGRPVLLDLFCCAGGAAVGYHRAGFDIVGVDIAPQPNYPYPFVQGDALEVLQRLLDGGRLQFGDRAISLPDIAAAHTSPPCQAYSITRHTHDREHPDLVQPTRELLRATGLPYVIENVVGAPLLDPLTLCGSEFDLTAHDDDGTLLALRRHRLFESNVWLMGPGGCRHRPDVPVAGVYGGGRDDRTRRTGWGARGGYTPSRHVRAELLGIDWMTQAELSQSIPPAYTEWIGHQLLQMLDAPLPHTATAGHPGR